MHVNTENKSPQQKVCMVKQKNQQYCTRQQANRNQVLHATCFKTQPGFVFKICIFFHKQRFHVLFSYPRKWTFVSLLTTVFPLSVTTQNFSAVKAFGSISVRPRKTTPILSFSAGKGDSQDNKKAHTPPPPSFQLHSETLKPGNSFCKNPSGWEKQEQHCCWRQQPCHYFKCCLKCSYPEAEVGEPLQRLCAEQPAQPQPTNSTKDLVQPQHSERHAAKTLSIFRVLVSEKILQPSLH